MKFMVLSVFVVLWNLSDGQSWRTRELPVGNREHLVAGDWNLVNEWKIRGEDNVLDTPGLEYTTDKRGSVDLCPELDSDSKLPNDLSDFRFCTILQFSQSSLRGTLPSSIERMTSLHTIRLDETSLSGTLPLNITKLPRLTAFYAFRTR